MLIFIDIETVPSGTLSDYPFELPEKPTESDVKIGNTKDEEKVKAKIAEQFPKLVKEWDESCKKIKSKAEEQLRRESLDHLKARILCLSYAIEEEPAKCLIGTEQEILEQLWEVVNDGVIPAAKFTVVGQNVVDFDLQIMYLRCIKYGMLRMSEWIKNNASVDLAKEYRVNPYSKLYISMDNMAKFLGIEGKKGMTGAQVYDYYIAGKIDEICDYCNNDVEVSRNVYYKINFSG